MLAYKSASCWWLTSRSLQEDLRIAQNQGGRLLESIKEPVLKNPEYIMNQDELENLATVQRYDAGLRGLGGVPVIRSWV